MLFWIAVVLAAWFVLSAVIVLSAVVISSRTNQLNRSMDEEPTTSESQHDEYSHLRPA